MRHERSKPLAVDLPSKEVRPVSPPAPYIGGKRNLSRRLCALIDATPHDTYVEPFVGMGGVFLKRTRQPRAEVINDISADVTTLFRILQRHYPQFMDVLKWQITSRAEFDRLRAAAPDTLTDLERAARFLYLQRLSFGGKVDGRNFGVDRRTPARFDVTKLAPMLDELHQRLTGVVIERLPYADLIRRYDGPGTLFFLDPPYWGCEGDYGPGVFERADFERLADQLAGIAGGFILTINATDGAREVFGRFDQVEVDTTYTIATASSGGGKRVKELIVRG
ncbi:DNA adenine methylase [Sphingomonas sp. TREG-RG-20F-R18-01]|uniref:DNA adenine methylase n=1 Tax=Sphingomonas sp. TREG-RG-20F-R18-01 TaxID=2914982 RepID=UPI001F57237B|nr:DNA adenine methylase [Sphingomonas sp. TREG-RG-20F-R18-01]